MSSAGQPRLSACADTLFLDRPFLERAQRIARAGFVVEFWGWSERPVDELADDPEIEVGAFTGYLGGAIVDPGASGEFIAGCRRTVAVAERLNCRTLFLSSGQISQTGEVLHAIARHPIRRWATAFQTLCRVAEIGEQHGLVYVLEHLNTKIDHPGYPLPHVEDVAELITAIGSPNVRMLLDVYHAQVQEGNVTQLVRDYGHLLGHVHVADAPGRHEPGTGEIRYARVVEELRAVGYQGLIGLEAFPETTSEQALARFAETFR